MLRRLAVPGLLIGAALLVYWPVLAGASFCLRDFLAWTLPSRALLREALLEGRLALWQPYLGLGMPAVAEPVNGVFYPPHLLLALFPLVTGVNLLFLLHVVVGGWGAYTLSRMAGARRAAAVAGGISFMLCGVTTSGWASGLGVLTGAWMPWCAAAAVRLGKTRGTCGIAAAAAALAPTALAGDPFQFMRAGLLALPLAIGAARAAGLPAWRAAARLALAGGLGALLAAAAIVPGLMSLDASERRGGLSQREAERWSLHPIRLIEMAAPGALGDPTDGASYAGARWLADDRLGPVPWSHSVYLGIGLVALAPLAFRRRSTTGRTLASPLAIAAGVGLVLALGRNTPVFRVARAIVPGLAYFRYPEKFLDLCAVACAALIALGADAALREPRAAARWAGAAAAVLLLGVPAARLLGAPPSMAHALGVAAAMAAALAFALAWIERRSWTRAGPALIVLLITADLAMAAAPLLRWIPAAAIADAPPPLQRTPSGPPPRIYRDPSLDDWPAAGVEEHAVLEARTLRGNLAALHGLGVVPGYESAHAARWHILWDALSARGESALRLLGVDAVVAGRRIASPGLEPRGGDFPVVHSVKRRLPRAYLVARTHPLLAGPGDLLALDVVEGRVALVEATGARLDGPDRDLQACDIVRFERERIDVTCPRTDRSAMLVLIEAWAPGWQATVDGAEARIWRVNALLRGVRLEAGAHEVTFRYRPREVVWGAALSALGLLVVLVLVGRGRFARRAAGSLPPAATSPP